MGEYIYASLVGVRDGTQTLIASPVYLQKETVSAREAAEYQGADPHYTYRFYTRDLALTDPNLVLARDYVLDLQNLDPLTGQLRKYLIISDPHIKQLLFSWEWVAYRYRGA